MKKGKMIEKFSLNAGFAGKTAVLLHGVASLGEQLPPILGSRNSQAAPLSFLFCLPNVRLPDPRRKAVLCTALLTSRELLERTSTTFLEGKQTLLPGLPGTQSFQRRSFKCIKDCLGPNHRD